MQVVAGAQPKEVEEVKLEEAGLEREVTVLQSTRSPLPAGTSGNQEAVLEGNRKLVGAESVSVVR
ncbi:hypothetical protein LTR17_001751 [Elasticomyces elasticus]|nr:hypothetical protein LTR17_001751 [Elasticomyces elasticus]